MVACEPLAWPWVPDAYDPVWAEAAKYYAETPRLFFC
jgi:hypothetical protein